MNRAVRAVATQAAMVAILAGLMMILLAAGGTLHNNAGQARSYRPATEQERRQAEIDRLRAELDRYAEQRDLEQASRTPTGYLGH